MKTIIKFFMINAQLLGFAGVLILFVGFSSCKKNDTTDMNGTNGTVSYSGSFVKSTDTVVTSATGTTTSTFNPTTMVLTYTITWSDLTSNAVSMHFHDAGLVIIPITGFAAATNGTFSGSATLTSDQATDLAAGKIYSQIHSTNFPGGEIKATLSQSSNNYMPGNDYNY